MHATNVVGRSRRELFATHAGEPGRLARCPICQLAIDQDHEEALQLQALRPCARQARRPAANRAVASASPAVEEYAFDLV